MIVEVGDADEWLLVVDEVCKDCSSLIMVVCDEECVDVRGGVTMLSSSEVDVVARCVM